MDLGIKGKNAIIAASSAGLGFACAESLAKEGVNVVINGRDADRLKNCDSPPQVRLQQLLATSRLTKPAPHFSTLVPARTY
jgi:NAD(P)-dependent dehydrogenase (short-subunit alcohol dehydrogenase family)